MTNEKTECSVIMFVRAEPGKKVPASRTLMRALEVSHNDITFSTGEEQMDKNKQDLLRLVSQILENT